MECTASPTRKAPPSLPPVRSSATTWPGGRRRRRAAAVGAAAPPAPAPALAPRAAAAISQCAMLSRLDAQSEAAMPLFGGLGNLT
jgi:hypothetical protein